MNFYALSPPTNGAALSDNVIGSVVQRAWPSRSRGTIDAAVLNRREDGEEVSPYKRRPTNQQTPYTKVTAEAPTNVPREGSNACDEVSSASRALSSVIDFMEQTDAQTGRRHQTFRASDLETANRLIETIQGAEHPITAEMQAVIVAEALKQKIQHRERCRVNQARYRKKQRKAKGDVQEKITKLQSEIKELELRRLEPIRLPAVVPSIWALAPTYFRHFCHFVSSPATQHAAAESFLRERLAPDVANGSSFGVEAHIENWKLFALYFGDINLVLNGLNVLAPGTLVAGVTITVTINNNTLRYAFPHLNSDRNGGAEGGAWSPLAAKLLGQRLVMRGSVVFGWDNSSEQVVRLQTRADMLTPMLTLLGSNSL